MLIDYKRGQTSVVIRVKLRDSSSTVGAGLTGLTKDSAGLIVATIANNEATTTRYRASSSELETITTLGTYAAPTSGKARFKEVDATNHPGVYEIQLEDARLAVSSAKALLISLSGATNLVQTDALIGLRDVDPYDAVRFGLTALPNAAAEASGGLYTRGSGAGQITQDANGRINVNVKAYGDSAGTFSGGRPEVNTSHAAGTAWNSGAIGASTLAADTITAAKIADGAIDAATFAAGAINASAIASDAITAAKVADGTIDAATFAAGAINAAAIAADAITDAKVAADVTIASVTGAVGSVTGAVGSVTGNVGGNVTGSVGSVATGGISAASFAAGAIDAAAIAADAIGSSELAASAVTEIQSGLSTLDAAGVRTAVGLASANLDTQLSGIQADTDNLQTRIPAALVSGRIDASVGAMAADVVTASAIAADAIGSSELAASAVTEIQSGLSTLDAAGVRAAVGLSSANLDAQLDALPTAAENASAVAAQVTTDHGAGSYIRNTEPLDAAGVRSAVGLASANLDTQIDALPTNAELATALAAADDATLAAVAALASAIAALNNLSSAQVATVVSAALSAEVPDSIPAIGDRPSLNEAAYLTFQYLLDRVVVGTTQTVHKPDGTTALATSTLDNATAPTSLARAS